MLCPFTNFRPPFTEYGELVFEVECRVFRLALVDDDNHVAERVDVLLLVFQLFLELLVLLDLLLDDVEVASDRVGLRHLGLGFREPIREVFELELLQFHQVLM